MKIIVIVIITLTFISCNANAADIVDEQWTILKKNRTSYVNQLVLSIKQCIAKNDTFHPVFHGCIDWHSAVHGHWALLRAYNVLKDKELLSMVLQSLNEIAMDEEYIYLKNNSSFEMPYGRSWFLLLMKEYELVTGSKKYRYISDYVAKSVLNYLLPREFDPSIGEYMNQSWAYRNLMEYYKYTKDEDSIVLIKKEIHSISNSNINFEMDKSHPGFFSLWGNLAHLFTLSMDKEKFIQWLKKDNPEAGSLEPIDKLSKYNSHHLSINYSRAWSLWSVYSITKDKKYLESYINHILMGISIHDKYKDNYYRYGHWVPQFGIYAITASMF